MRIFLTGATGFIGSAIVPELIKAGHQVLGMTRSEQGAAALEAAGAEPYRGTLEDPESLRRGAAQCDGVIHTAFDHDFSRFVANCEKDRRAIEAMGAALAGSDRLLLITSGVGLGSSGHGEPAREEVVNFDHPNPRKLSEQTGAALAQQGVKLAVMRLPQVHNTEKAGLITPYIEIARAKGTVAYVSDGQNRWAAVHVSDAARLYRLAFERQEAARYHAVAEEGVAAKDIATVVGRGLSLPVESLSPGQASAHFGWMAGFIGMDLSASSKQTQAQLDWQPTGPDLLTDLAAMRFAAA